MTDKNNAGASWKLPHGHGWYVLYVGWAATWSMAAAT